MLVAGLTGGIGSGKTTFASRLAERGAEVIDADQLGRIALEPGKHAWHSAIDQFGHEILSAGSMEIDRKRLAAIVFGDKRKLAALNAIVHPAILAGIADTLETLRRTNEIVVIDAALFVELDLNRAMDVLIVMVADEEKRIKRVQSERAMTPEEIRRRIAAQKTPAELIEEADIVVHNDGSREDLEREADRVWGELVAMRDARDP